MTACRATPMTGYEANCLAAADHFVAVRGRTPRDRSHETFATLALAEAFAATFRDRCTLI